MCDYSYSSSLHSSLALAIGGPRVLLSLEHSGADLLIMAPKKPKTKSARQNGKVTESKTVESHENAVTQVGNGQVQKRPAVAHGEHDDPIIAELRSAAATGDIDMVNSLCDGLTVKQINTGSPIEQTTALHKAAIYGSHGVVSALLAKGADPDTVDFRGRTALMFAAANGEAAVIPGLLDGGADPDLCANNKWSALMFASCNGHPEAARGIVRWVRRKLGDGPLIQHLARQDGDGNQASDLARQSGHEELADALVAASSDATSNARLALLAEKRLAAAAPTTTPVPTTILQESASTTTAPAKAATGPAQAEPAPAGLAAATVGASTVLEFAPPPAPDALSEMPGLAPEEPTDDAGSSQESDHAEQIFARAKILRRRTRVMHEKDELPFGPFVPEPSVMLPKVMPIASSSRVMPSDQAVLAEDKEIADLKRLFA